MEKKLLRLEIYGLFFIITLSVFFQNLYKLCTGTILGIMFGSVNNSIWEIAKTILLPYILWSIIEIMCMKIKFHKFVVAKVISLYFLGISYIILCLVFSAFDNKNYSMPEFIAAVITVITALFLSYKLTLSEYRLEKLFAPALFMMLLFIALYCSFTPFPPENYIFMDRTTGLYGLIPEYIDNGDIALDTLYHI